MEEPHIKVGEQKLAQTTEELPWYISKVENPEKTFIEDKHRPVLQRYDIDLAALLPEKAREIVGQAMVVSIGEVEGKGLRLLPSYGIDFMNLMVSQGFALVVDNVEDGVAEKYNEYLSSRMNPGSIPDAAVAMRPIANTVFIVPEQPVLALVVCGVDEDVAEWLITDPKGAESRDEVMSSILKHVLPACLDKEAMSLSQGWNDSVRVYEMLARKADLKDLARVAPGSITLLSESLVESITDPETGQVKKGLKLNEIIRQGIIEKGGPEEPNPAVYSFCKKLPMPRDGDHMPANSRMALDIASSKIRTDGFHKMDKHIHWKIFLHLCDSLGPEKAEFFSNNPEAGMSALRRRFPDYDQKELEEMEDGVEVENKFYAISRELIGDIHDAVYEIEKNSDRSLLGVVEIDNLSKQYGAAKSLEGMFRFSEAYHNALRNIQHEEVLADAKRRYTKFPEPVFKEAAIGDLRLKWLGDNVALAEEGFVLSHCVGTYDKFCTKGESIIYSVCDKDDTKIATLELDDEYTIAQLRGYKNSLVNPDIYEAVETMLSESLAKSREEDVNNVKNQTSKSGLVRR